MLRIVNGEDNLERYGILLASFVVALGLVASSKTLLRPSELAYFKTSFMQPL